MSQAARLSPQAWKDPRRISRWYEDQREGLGRRFLREVRVLLAAISTRPFSFPIALKDMRRGSVHRFPYGAFFVVDPGDIPVILFVVDLRRNPRLWRRRPRP